MSGRPKHMSTFYLDARYFNALLCNTYELCAIRPDVLHMYSGTRFKPAARSNIYDHAKPQRRQEEEEKKNEKKKTISRFPPIVIPSIRESMLL